MKNTKYKTLSIVLAALLIASVALSALIYSRYSYERDKRAQLNINYWIGINSLLSSAQSITSDNLDEYFEYQAAVFKVAGNDISPEINHMKKLPDSHYSVFTGEYFDFVRSLNTILVSQPDYEQRLALLNEMNREFQKITSLALGYEKYGNGRAYQLLDEDCEFYGMLEKQINDFNVKYVEEMLKY